MLSGVRRLGSSRLSAALRGRGGRDGGRGQESGGDKALQAGNGSDSAPDRFTPCPVCEATFDTAVGVFNHTCPALAEDPDAQWVFDMSAGKACSAKAPSVKAFFDDIAEASDAEGSADEQDSDVDTDGNLAGFVTDGDDEADADMSLYQIMPDEDDDEDGEDPELGVRNDVSDEEGEIEPDFRDPLTDEEADDNDSCPDPKFSSDESDAAVAEADLSSSDSESDGLADGREPRPSSSHAGQSIAAEVATLQEAMAGGLQSINIQWPFTQLLIGKKKLKELRSFSLERRKLAEGQLLWLAETQGKPNADRNAMIDECPIGPRPKRTQVVAVIRFGGCRRYRNRGEFLDDRPIHCAKEGGIYDWGPADEDGEHWAWEVSGVWELQTPVPIRNRPGIHMFGHHEPLKLDDAALRTAEYYAATPRAPRVASPATPGAKRSRSRSSSPLRPAAAPAPAPQVAAAGSASAASPARDRSRGRSPPRRWRKLVVKSPPKASKKYGSPSHDTTPTRVRGKQPDPSAQAASLPGDAPPPPAPVVVQPPGAAFKRPASAQAAVLPGVTPPPPAPVLMQRPAAAFKRPARAEGYDGQPCTPAAAPAKAEPRQAKPHELCKG